MLRSIKRYGGDEVIVDRLLLHGDSQYFTWVIRSLVDDEKVYYSLNGLSEVLDVPITKLKYAYFSACYLSKGELKALPEYENVMQTLLEVADLPSLWISMQKTCYRQLKRLCIEELVSRDETVLTIMDMLKVSHGLVYNVRKDFIQRELKKLSYGA